MDRDACKSCAPVTHTLPVLHLIKQLAVAEGHGGEEVAVSWPLKLSKLASATENGCAFCSFVLDRFFYNNRTWVRLRDPVKPWYRGCKEEEQRRQAVEYAREIVGRLENDNFSFQISPSHSKNKPAPDFDKFEIVALADKHHDAETTKELFYITHVTMEAYSPQGSPPSRLFNTRPPSTNPASAESFKSVRGWLHECTTGHSRCGPPGEKPLPTRVIDVSSREVLCLNVSQGSAHYAALSYCWGGTQTGATTAENLPERIEGFKESELPRTIQDAVRVTRELGLKYLWTDAQCILQDSDADKGHEVHKMAEIYKNAYVTLCAARAEGADEGFLQDRSDEETKLPKDLFPMSYRIPDRDATDLTAALHGAPESWAELWVREEVKYDVQQEPITSRAWTMQERLLSPRFLHYGARLFWQCNTIQHCDGGVLSGSKDLLGPAHLLSNRMFPTQNQSITLFSLVSLVQTWYETVEDYSKREMTLPADKLPAIAGVAAEVSRISGIPYLAGLWKNNLLHDLMWTSTNRERFNRAERWRAPTWSWASVDSPVSYHKVTIDAIEEAEVLDCEVEPRFPEAPFGEVKSGKLHIHGPIARIDQDRIVEMLQTQGMAPAPPQSNDPAEWSAMVRSFLRTRPKPKGDGHREAEDARLPDNVYCMVTHSRHWKMENHGERRVQEMCYFGLLLEKNEDGCFERLGAFDNEDRDWLKGSTVAWERKTITLV